MLLRRSSPGRNRFAPPSVLAQALVGVEQRIATRPASRFSRPAPSSIRRSTGPSARQTWPYSAACTSSGLRDDVRSPAFISREVLWLTPRRPARRQSQGIAPSAPLFVERWAFATTWSLARRRRRGRRKRSVSDRLPGALPLLAQRSVLIALPVRRRSGSFARHRFGLGPRGSGRCGGLWLVLCSPVLVGVADGEVDRFGGRPVVVSLDLDVDLDGSGGE
jgi:hypothetical protein